MQTQSRYHTNTLKKILKETLYKIRSAGVAIVQIDRLLIYRLKWEEREGLGLVGIGM